LDRISLIFCVLSLIVTLGLAAWGYPYAALSVEKMAMTSQSVEAGEIPDVDLGDFGIVSVAEMLDYFIESPPVTTQAAGESVRRVRIQGC
jgi:hypothetical protein